MAVLLILLCVLSVGFAADTDHPFFQVLYPTVVMSSKPGGNITVQAGPDKGNIFLKSTSTGTIYIDGTDMMAIIEMLNSLPPIWSDMSEHGSLGNFLGGSRINLKIAAQDPEGNAVGYERISGAFPPGVSLDRSTGAITGIVPDIDAIYEFGIRATDNHGKHADQTFTIITHEKNQCRGAPCQNGGTCIDDINQYSCKCPLQFGGKMCQFACANKAVGISAKTSTIPDAQMSAHYSYKDYAAWNGRLDGLGWMGTEVTKSWLQVDLGVMMKWFSVATQGAVDAGHYTETYMLEYSTDGDTFKNVTDSSNNPMIFNGSKTWNKEIKQTLPSPVDARYVRFIPHTAPSNPGMRVEVYACPL